MIDHTDTVAAVKADLLARGYDLSGPCGAFQITSRVAWTLRVEGWGPIFSTANGCDTHDERYRADTLMLQDGTTVDILQKAESNNGDTSDPSAYNIPQWAQTGNQPPSNWRAPWNPDSGLPPGPNPPDPPPTGCPCAAELVQLQQAVTLANAQLIALKGQIDLLMAKPAPVYTGTLFGIRITLLPIQG